jgi:hypothetical protein
MTSSIIPVLPSISPTGSGFMGAKLNLTPQQSAVLSIEVGLVKGILGMCLNGNLNGFSEMASTAGGITEQAIKDPNSYTSPYKILRP